MPNQKLAVFILYLVIAAILLTQLYYPKEAPSSELALVPYVLFIFVFFFLKIDGRWFILGTLVLLVLTGMILILKNDEKSANLIAIHAYYSLTIGVILMLIELIMKRKDEELYFISWFDVSESIKYPQSKVEQITIIVKETSMPKPPKICFRDVVGFVSGTIEWLAGWFWELTIFSGVLLVALGFIILKKLDEPLYFIDVETNLVFFLVPSLLLAILLGYLRCKDSLRTSPHYGLIKNMSFFSFSHLLGNLFSFLYHFYVARLLSITDYGILNALIATFSLILIPINSFTSLVIKQIAASSTNSPRISALSKAALKIVLLAAIFVSILIMAFRNSFESFFHIESNFLIVSTFAITIVLFAIYSIILGILNGLQRFFASGLIFIIGSVGKLVFALVFMVALGFGLVGALGALAAMALIGILLGGSAIYIIIKERTDPFSFSKIKSEYVLIVCIDVAFFLILNGDLILLRNKFPEQTLGLYSAASILAKIITFALTPLTAVTFPKIVEQKNAGSKSFFVTLAMILVGGLVFLVFYYFFGSYVISFLYSSKYLQANNFLILLSISVLVYSINLAFSRYFIAQENYKYALCVFVISIIGLTSFYIFSTIDAAPYFMLGINLAILLVSVCLFFIRSSLSEEKLYKY